MKAPQSSSFRPIRLALVALVAGAALVLPFADQASAHNAPATGTSRCETGLASWQATVAILNDFSEPMTVTAISSSAPVAGLGSVTPAGSSATATVGGLTGASVTVAWSVSWPNGDTATNSVTVARPAVACVGTVVTTTTTIAAPTTTTTAAAPTTTVATPTTTAAAPEVPVVTEPSPATTTTSTTVPGAVLGEGPVFPNQAPALPVLPVTGSSSSSVVVAALGFLFAGVATLIVASRRRRASASV
jgi:LPXTG-motif cell wall-anchored protein